MSGKQVEQNSPLLLYLVLLLRLYKSACYTFVSSLSEALLKRRDLAWLRVCVQVKLFECVWRSRRSQTARLQDLPEERSREKEGEGVHKETRQERTTQVK